MFKFSYSNEHVEEIEEYYEELSAEISYNQDRIYELEVEIEDGEEEVEKLISKLESMKNKLQKSEQELLKLKTELPQKEKQLAEYEEIIEDEEKRVNADRKEAFQDYILNMKPSDAISRKLRNNTSTVELLDEFCDSKKDFLILREQFSVYNNSGYVSLIITPCYRDIKVESTQPTMTELKQNVGKGVRYISCARLQPLLAEINKIDMMYKSIPKGSKFAFDCPFLIGGQTSDNRTGYGCEWIGGGDYIEGTLYGEVTDFMVAGIIFEGYSWY